MQYFFSKKVFLVMIFLCMAMQNISLFCAQKKKKKKQPTASLHAPEESRKNDLSSIKNPKINRLMKSLASGMENLPALLKEMKLCDARLRTEITYKGHTLDDVTLDNWMLAWQENYDSIMKSEGNAHEEKISSFENSYLALSINQKIPSLQEEKKRYEEFCKNQEIQMRKLKAVCDELAKILFRGDERIRMIELIKTFDLKIMNSHKSIAQFITTILYKLTYHVKAFSKNNASLKRLQEAGTLKSRVEKVENAKKETQIMSKILELFNNLCKNSHALDKASKAFKLFLYEELFNTFEAVSDILTKRLELLEVYVKTLIASREEIFGCA